MNANLPPVLVVGGTGMLGNAIVDALIADGRVPVRVLVRPGKPDAAARLRERGVDVAEGDVLDPASLAKATRGVGVVVSALHNDPRVFLDGHRNLIDACEQSGVGRLIPSDFSIDFFGIEPGENANLAMRHEVVKMLAGRRVKPTHVLIGAFMDTILDPAVPFIDRANGRLNYWGDPGQLCDFTSVADTGRYVAAAAADPETPEVLRFAGDVLTMPQLAAAITRATGRTITAERVGDADALARLIEEKKRSAKSTWDYVFLQYHHNMVSGRAKLRTLDKARYARVKPETVEQFARKQAQSKPAAV